MQHGIIAGTQLCRTCTHHGGNIFPQLRTHISRNIHRTTVANQDCRFRTLFCHAQEAVFQCQLYLQRCFLSFVEEVLIIRQVVHPCLCKQGWHFWNREYLKTKTREVLDNPYQRRCLARAWSSGEDNFLNVFHFGAKIINFNRLNK